MDVNRDLTAELEPSANSTAVSFEAFGPFFRFNNPKKSIKLVLKAVKILKLLINDPLLLDELDGAILLRNELK